MTPRQRSLGFPYLEFGREYDPVEVKIKMPQQTYGRDKRGHQAIPYGPYEEWTKLWCISSCSDYRTYSFFVRHPTLNIAFAFRQTDIEVLFEAEPFFYIMTNASRNNKLMFFRQAVIENKEEVEKFLRLLEASDLSEKDKRRAKTWIYRRKRNLDI